MRRKHRIPDAVLGTTIATCPWCGRVKRVYVRAGSDLVCAECAQRAQAIEATEEDNLENE